MSKPLKLKRRKPKGKKVKAQVKKPRSLGGKVGKQGGTMTSTVANPNTRTSTKTSTVANPRDNVTVTGGAGDGDTIVHIYEGGPGKIEKKAGKKRTRSLGGKAV